MAILDENRMFGDIFKELRLGKNLSQDKISEELDVSQGLITKWESHQSTPSPEMLDYIADYFNVSVDYLIGRTNNKKKFNDIKSNNIDLINMIYDKLLNIDGDELNMINKMIDLFNSNDLTFNFNTKYVRNNDKNTK